MKFSNSKLFAAVLALILVWVIFTQVRMLDGKVVDQAKATALKNIEYPETAKFDKLQETQHGGTRVVCGEYRVKPEGEDYGPARPFIVEVREGEESRFSEFAEDVAQYCNLPGKR